MSNPTLEQLKMELEEATSNARAWAKTRDSLRDAIAQMVAEYKVGDVVAQTRTRSWQPKETTIIYRITRVLPEDSWREGEGIIARYVGRRIRKDGTDGVEESTIATYNGPIRRARPEEIPGHNATVTPEKT